MSFGSNCYSSTYFIDHGWILSNDRFGFRLPKKALILARRATSEPRFVAPFLTLKTAKSQKNGADFPSTPSLGIKNVGIFLHRRRKSTKLGSGGRLERKPKFGLTSPASHGRTVAWSLGRLMKSLCCQWLWGNPGIGKPPNGGKVGFRSTNGWMRGCQSVSKRAMLRSRKERRFASHCLRMAISSSYELTR